MITIDEFELNELGTIEELSFKQNQAEKRAKERRGDGEKLNQAKNHTKRWPKANVSTYVNLDVAKE